MMEYASSMNFSNNKFNLESGVPNFRYFIPFANFVLVTSLVICLGWRVLRLVFYSKALFLYFLGKSSNLRNGYPFLGKSSNLRIGYPLATGFTGICSPKSSKKEEEEEEKEEEEEMDIMGLKKALKKERECANNAYLELEKERIAASTAADEAMGMILRLQNEKSAIEMEANQYRRMAEQKQMYDQEVIHHLRWIVLKHESERSVLDSQLNLCRQRLKNCLRSEEMEGLGWSGGDDGLDSTSGDDLTEGLISSLDMDTPSKPTSNTPPPPHPSLWKKT